MRYSKSPFIFFLLLLSCHHEEVKPTEAAQDYVIFGHYYGYCLGDKCIEIFKLTSQTLSEDSNDNYPAVSHAYVGNFHLLSDTQFEKVKLLNAKIPPQLLSTSATVIGQPDEADGGGIYFEVSTNGKVQFWLIDKMENNIPEYLRPFVEEVEADVQLISN